MVCRQRSQIQLASLWSCIAIETVLGGICMGSAGSAPREAGFGVLAATAACFQS